MKERFINAWRKTAAFFVNPRLLLCFGIAWFITNGWAYIAVICGTLFDVNWLFVIGTGYLAIIWMPFTPEKVVTAVIALLLLRALFPKDQQSLKVLKQYHQKYQIKRMEKGKQKVMLRFMKNRAASNKEPDAI